MRNTTLYRLDGARTFRRRSRGLMGERNKKNVGWGTNLQNIEKSMRAIYIPDGYEYHLKDRCRYWLDCGDTSVFTEEELLTLRVMLQVDQSGAEALIVAYDCEAGDYRQLFKNNIKVHVYVALKLFKDIWQEKMREKGGVDLNVESISSTPITKLRLNPNWKELDLLIKDSDNWSLQERYYYLAKQTVHSSNYDIQWAMFIMNILEKSGGKIVIKREQGEFFLNTYRALFPEIPDRNRRVRMQVDRSKMIFNMHGHPYIVTNYNILESTYKELFAWGPQSTVGEITRIAFSNLQRFIEMESKRWDILQDNHDSYLVQCPLLDVKECSLKMQEFMNQRLVSPIDGEEFNMKSECQVGFNWSGHKKEINELGLRELKW